MDMLISSLEVVLPAVLPGGFFVADGDDRVAEIELASGLLKFHQIVEVEWFVAIPSPLDNLVLAVRAGLDGETDYSIVQ